MPFFLTREGEGKKNKVDFFELRFQIHIFKKEL